MSRRWKPPVDKGGHPRCVICGYKIPRGGRCKRVFQVEPGVWEHA